MTWYWLSFADPTRPKGFLGAVIVNGDVEGAAEAALLTKLRISGKPFKNERDAAFAAALEVACQLGVNPGGECLGTPLPDEAVARIPEHWLRRLLTREECAEVDAEMGKRP